MSRYLLDSKLHNSISNRLLQAQAVTNLINEVTSPINDSRNDDVNTSAWLISEQLESILKDLEQLRLVEEINNERI